MIRLFHTYKPNKRFYMSVLFICTFFLFFYTTSVIANDNSLKLTAEEQDWIIANPVITVANEMDWPPFDYVDAGKPAGYSIDLTRLIKQKTGLQIKFVNGYNWNELLQQFKAGEIDVMPAMYLNNERRKFTLFTRSYHSQPSVMVVHKNNKDITDVDSLTKKRVAVIRGFVITSTLQSVVSGIKIIPVKNIIEGMKAVSLGEADAFIDSIGTVSYHLEHHYIPNLKVIGRLNKEELANPALHFGVAKNNAILHSIIDKSLRSISRNEKMTLEKRWINISDSIAKQDFSKKIVLTPEQRLWLSEHPVIRIGIDAGYAPYSSLDSDGRYIGIAPDFINLLSDKLGVTFEVVADKTWPQILQGAKDHKIDVIATAVITEDRKSFLDFTQEYIPTPLVMMSRIHDNRIKNPSDIDDMTVALVEGYSSSAQVKQEHPKANIYRVATPAEGLHAVSSGIADTYIGVVGINLYQSQQKGITNLKIAGNYNVLTNGQRFAVRSDWSELTLILERALDSISEEERKEIFDKWINIPFVEQIDYSLFWKALIVFFVIISFLYIHNLKLSKEIKLRKWVEHKLIDVNIKLEKEKIEADKANIAKSQFLSSMSHELRTPLNSIMGFSQLLEMNNTNEHSKDMLSELSNASDHLLSLINEILDLSKIEAGKVKLELESHSLSMLIAECVSIVRYTAQKRSIEIEDNVSVCTGYFVNVDGMRFKQVLLNLLTNAIKYNNEGGDILIDCKPVDTNMIHISVIDTGNGLTEKQQDQLFKPFERVGAEESDIEGTGLGLVICKQLIEMMGGSIGVESEITKGSKFWIKIPLSQIDQ